MRLYRVWGYYPNNGQAKEKQTGNWASAAVYRDYDQEMRADTHLGTEGNDPSLFWGLYCDPLCI